MLSVSPEPLHLSSSYIEVQILLCLLFEIIECFQDVSQPHLRLAKLLDEAVLLLLKLREIQ